MNKFRKLSWCICIWIASYLFAWVNSAPLVTNSLYDSWLPRIGSSIFLVTLSAIAVLYKDSKWFIRWCLIAALSIAPLWIAGNYITPLMDSALFEWIVYVHFGFVTFPYFGFSQITVYWVAIPLLQSVLFATLYWKYCKKPLSSK